MAIPNTYSWRTLRGVNGRSRKAVHPICEGIANTPFLKSHQAAATTVARSRHWNTTADRCIRVIFQGSVSIPQ
jgi:hypothetical protein